MLFSAQQFDKQVFWYFSLNWLLLFTSCVIIAGAPSFSLWVKSEAGCICLSLRQFSQEHTQYSTLSPDIQQSSK